MKNKVIPKTDNSATERVSSTAYISYWQKYASLNNSFHDVELGTYTKHPL